MSTSTPVPYWIPTLRRAVLFVDASIFVIAALLNILVEIPLCFIIPRLSVPSRTKSR